MTTEDQLQEMLDLNPDDHNPRLVLADFLDEQNDPRAAGYRALGELRLWPYTYLHGNASYWSYHDGRGKTQDATDVPLCHALPRAWFYRAHGALFWIHGADEVKSAKLTRREADDFAARLFSRLTREQCELAYEQHKLMVKE